MARRNGDLFLTTASGLFLCMHLLMQQIFGLDRPQRPHSQAWLLVPEVPRGLQELDPSPSWCSPSGTP